MSLEFIDNRENTLLNDARSVISEKFFKQIEQHVVGHFPLAVTDSLSGMETIEYHNFRGLNLMVPQNNLSYMIRCSCGQCWSVNHWDIQFLPKNFRIVNVLEEFCSMINYRYVSNREGNTIIYKHFDSSLYNNCAENTKVISPPKQIIPPKFDNAVDGLEI